MFFKHCGADPLFGDSPLDSKTSIQDGLSVKVNLNPVFNEKHFICIGETPSLTRSEISRFE